MSLLLALLLAISIGVPHAVGGGPVGVVTPADTVLGGPGIVAQADDTVLGGPGTK
jgi:hypothetical protein